ncbi:MAG: radical SAM protein [Metallosphaera sp.]|uniref:Radical SAM domain-containing protein n=1 Tax=Metallosphaera cuprina (strain Ar-4) TaxID=1006006 RepID=F4G1U5_METCR|nr:radical SAM protein [Metallosphaera cuprina]AEB94834.1 radical SAM domain-containing protein [Metallosphaera cuprina Ar-4]
MEVLLSAGTYYGIKKGMMYSQTAYGLMTGGCINKCAFCSQSLSNPADKTYLSRVKWFPVDLEIVKEKLSIFKRFCLQTVVKPGFEEELVKIAGEIQIRKSITTVPISSDYLRTLKERGVDYLGTGMDTTESNWERVSKPGKFSDYIDFIKRAVSIFGKRRVFVHLIYGLGEREDEFVSLMEYLYSIGAEVALFAFTPIKGTPMGSMKPPKLEDYRRIQKIRFKLSHGFESDEKSVLTSGCPSCDRPFYNEDPRGELYNVPFTVREK